MSVTVVVNYMTVSHKGSTGLSIAFPDVCKTPILGVPVPIPYPNIAMSSDVSKGSKKVKCDGKKVLLKSSEISRSMGDEAGVQMGVVSNKQMGKGKFANYSFDVKFEGKNVCRLADPTTQNRGTMNTAAFAHIQPPDMVSADKVDITLEGCIEVDKKAAEQAEQSDSPASGPGKSGIISRHWSKMQEYLDKSEPKWLIYFRATGPDCAKWIDKGNEPKPHEWTDGLSMKEGRRADLEPRIQSWIQNHLTSDTSKKLVSDGFMEMYKPHTLKLKEIYGVVISKRKGEEGRPVRGTKNWKNVVKAGEWMTADYDMMDIIKGEGACDRPTAGDYGRLKLELNNAMNWPGIQHPHQTAWNTRQDKGFKGGKDNHFSNLEAVDTWMVDVAKTREEKGFFASRLRSRQVPKGTIAPGRQLKLIDDNLTVMGPKAGLALEKTEDYFDALACCGCLETALPEEEGDSDEAKAEKAEKRAPHEFSSEKEGGH